MDETVKTNTTKLKEEVQEVASDRLCKAFKAYSSLLKVCYRIDQVSERSTKPITRQTT
jgi:hypothetical protein